MGGEGGTGFPDKLLYPRRYFSLKDRYTVCDEKNDAVLFAEKPGGRWKETGAILNALVVGFIVWSFLALVPSLAGDERTGRIMRPVSFLLGAGVFYAVLARSARMRIVSFYTDVDRRVKLIDLVNDGGLVSLEEVFTVRDGTGMVLARLSKNPLYDLFRERWRCSVPDAVGGFVALEHTVIRSIAKRLFGPMLGLFETDFTVMGRGRKLGVFNRKKTLYNKWFLDLSLDHNRTIDWRVAVALGAILNKQRIF